MRLSPLRKQKSRKTILDFILAMTVLIVLSSFPFFHDIITNKDGVLPFWVPDIGIEKMLTDADGKVLGYSSYRLFIYFFLINCYGLIAWVGWFLVAKNKYYRLAILTGVFSSSYHIFLILSNNRKTDLNNFEIKLTGSVIICCVLFIAYNYHKKIERLQFDRAFKRFGESANKVNFIRLFLVWMVLLAASSAPYLHDIITIRSVGVKTWVPQLGIENFLTNSIGHVWGFTSYRILILTIMLQIFAQIGWAGWLHDSVSKLYRPFLVVPMGLSLYQIIVIILDQSDAYLNQPDVKLLVILAISSVVCYFYFFKNKRFNTKTETPNKMPQSVHNHIKNN